MVLRLGTGPLNEAIEAAIAHVRSFRPVNLVIAENPTGPSGEPAMPPVMRMTHNVGYAVALNRAIAAQPMAPSSCVIVMTADARPSPDALAELMSAHDQIGGVIAPVLRVDDVLWVGGRWHAVWGWARHALGDLPEAPRAVDWADGACLSFARSTFDTVGGFDEGTFLYGEDLQFCLMARRCGHRVTVVPRAVVEQSSGMYGRAGAHGYLIVRNEIRAAAAVRGRVRAFPVATTGVVRAALELLRAARRPAARRHHLWQAWGMVLGVVAGLSRSAGPPPAHLCRVAGIPYTSPGRATVEARSNGWFRR